VKISIDVVRTRDPNVLVGLLTKEIDLATVSALNKTAKNTQVEASKQIRGELNLPAAQVKKQLHIRKASVSRQVAEVRVTRKASRLMAFKPRQTKAGVTFRIKKDRPRRRLRHAFITTMKSGHTGVFMRRGDARLPIDEVFTTTVIEAFKNTLDRLRPYTNERLLVNLKAEAKYRLSKSFGRTRKRKVA
jgi:Prophage minor tail protein Z (GPZ)